MPAPESDLETRIEKLDPQERYNLIRIQEKLREFALTPKTVGDTLPEAVLIGDGEQRKLSKSMVEITERAIDLSVKKDPEPLSTALFPIIGSAIRKAINRIIAETMANMNAGLEKTISGQRLRWRIESWKTGVPFFEIVLRSTLRYRVEHAFLIHKGSGILIRGLSAPGAKTADDDMVASMLTAVRDYIKDSMALSRAENVEGITAGDYSLLIEDGPHASLAVIVRGTADGDVRRAMQDAIEAIHLRLGTALKAFSGDVDQLAGADAFLKPCLISRDKQERKGKPIYAIALVSLVAASVIGLSIAAGVDGVRRNAFISALSREKGMMVAYSRNGLLRTEARVLRDPRAKSIESVAAEHRADLRRFDIEIEEFVSPALSGDLKAPARQIPEELLALARRLAGYALYFEQDSGELRAGQETAVRAAGGLIAELVDKAKKHGFEVSVEITGHAAGGNQDETGITVSEVRAAKAMALFAALNAPLVKYVRTRGVGVSEPVVAQESTEEDRIKNRSVTFKTIFR